MTTLCCKSSSASPSSHSPDPLPGYNRYKPWSFNATAAAAAVPPLYQYRFSGGSGSANDTVRRTAPACTNSHVYSPLLSWPLKHPPSLSFLQGAYAGNNQAFALYPQYGDTRGFAISSGADFPPPVSLNAAGTQLNELFPSATATGSSSTYNANLAWVAQYGERNSTARTQYQTDTIYFWRLGGACTRMVSWRRRVWLLAVILSLSVAAFFSALSPSVCGATNFRSCTRRHLRRAGLLRNHRLAAPRAELDRPRLPRGAAGHGARVRAHGGGAVRRNERRVDGKVQVRHSSSQGGTGTAQEENATSAAGLFLACCMLSCHLPFRRSTSLSCAFPPALASSSQVPQLAARDRAPPR